LATSFSVFEAWAAIEGKTKKHVYGLMGVEGMIVDQLILVSQYILRISRLELMGCQPSQQLVW